MYFKQIENNLHVKVQGWEGPIRSKRHGETTHSPKLLEKLRSRFDTAPTIDESVRRTHRNPSKPTIRYSTGGLSFAHVAAADGEPTAATTPEGKKRRKEPITTISDPVSISNPAADITTELRNTIKELTTFMATIRQEVDEKITALTVQVQILQSQSLDRQSTIEPTQQPTEQATLEQTVHSAVAVAVTAALAKFTSDIMTILQDRDTRIYDEIQGLRDNLSEMSQQQKPPPGTFHTVTYNTPQKNKDQRKNTPQRQQNLGSRIDYSLHLPEK
jgi:hypothetical protein